MTDHNDDDSTQGTTENSTEKTTSDTKIPLPKPTRWMTLSPDNETTTPGDDIPSANFTAPTPDER